MNSLRLLLYFFAAFGIATLAWAETVPLTKVPESLADLKEQAVLYVRYGRLESSLESLQRTGDDFEDDCNPVEVGTPAYDDCQQRYAEIQGSIEAFNQEARAYNAAVREAVQRDVRYSSWKTKTEKSERRPILTGDALEATQLKAMSRAAFRLGGDLAIAGHYEKSLPYLREAAGSNPECKMCLREFLKAERMMADPSAQEEEILIKMILEESEFPGMSIEDIDPRTKGDYVLDALEYGGENWERTLQYVSDLGYARPENKNIRAAHTELEQLAAESNP